MNKPSLVLLALVVLVGVVNVFVINDGINKVLAKMDALKPPVEQQPDLAKITARLDNLEKMAEVTKRVACGHVARTEPAIWDGIVKGTLELTGEAKKVEAEKKK